MFTITSTLLSLFATLASTPTFVTDVCDVVHPRTSTPTICEPHPEGAPRYDEVVCCKDELCFEQGAQGCLADEQPYHCEFGEVGSSGLVSCYFEVPNYCEVFPCAPSFESVPQQNPICCNAGICWNIWVGSYDCEPQDIYWCDDGVTNDDGTMTCFD